MGGEAVEGKGRFAKSQAAASPKNAAARLGLLACLGLASGPGGRVGVCVRALALARQVGRTDERGSLSLT